MLKLVINNQDLDIYQRSAIHEEEKKLEKAGYLCLMNIPEEEKTKLKKTFISRMQFKDAGMKEIMAELELKCFIERKILYENRERYPNLFKKMSITMEK
ncbi:MAG: hypothetical protein ACYDDB_03500 [bacterium]